MGKFAAIVLTLLMVAACASAPDVSQMAGAPGSYLIGTWTDMESIETFLDDGTFCSSSVSTESARSVGTWKAMSDGQISVVVTSSTNPDDITPARVAEVRVVLIPKADRLLMGYSCSHCPDGIAGSIYWRSLPPRTSCAIPGGGATDTSST